MADEKPKNPERYFKRDRIYKQHPAVADMPKLSDALKDRDKHGDTPLAAHEALAREAAIQAGEIEGETHYGRIRRLNNEWNADHPIYREHKAELHPWEGSDYNKRALHHVQFGIPNGGGAMSTHHDELRVTSTPWTDRDTGKEHKITRFERVPEGQSIVEAVGHALGEHPAAMQARLSERTGGEYPKPFGEVDRSQIAKQFGLRAYKQSMYDDPSPDSNKRQN